MEEVTLRPMESGDYDNVRELWMRIRGFGIRSIDDSREEVERFLLRNPGLSVVALEQERVIGAILCGHDGRQGSFYHVCVDPDRRRRGIGTRMAAFCMEALRRQRINRITLIAFSTNDGGNAFWKQIGWTCRPDCNYYEFALNKENIIRFIGSEEERQA